MNKSFGLNPQTNDFFVARHQVGDFGLHLGLIRSFSWGQNIPPQLPLFPGEPLAYHYYFDFVVGMLEKAGVRIDVALNGLSALCFTLLLFLIYKLPQRIFGQSRLLGILSVVLFLLHSSVTFVDFLAQNSPSLASLKDVWHLADYIHKGPFDGSIISIFFTLNVFLNQRHLIAALAITLLIFYLLIPYFFHNHRIHSWQIVSLGLLLGITSRLHTLIFASSAVIYFLLCLLFKKYRIMAYLLLPAVLIFSFHVRDILHQSIDHAYFNPGFLAQKPLSLESFITFWFLNLGIALILIPAGVIISKKPQQNLFLAVFSLFIIGNIWQLGFRIDHNHTLFNLFIIFANFYIAFFLIQLLRKSSPAFFILLFCLTASGFLDLMAVKNDFRYPIVIAEKDPFVYWLKNETERNDIFLAKRELYDPILLSGRKNYLGHSYYLEVMGYNVVEREALVKTFFEADELSDFDLMRKEGIDFLVIPKGKLVDFPYVIDDSFLIDHLSTIYEDGEFTVLKL